MKNFFDSIMSVDSLLVQPWLPDRLI